MDERETRSTSETDVAPSQPADVTRRGFLSGGLAAVAGVSALAAAASPLRHLDPDDIPSLEEFLQKHYKEMTPEDKERVFERIREDDPEASRSRSHGRAIHRRWTVWSSCMG